MHETASCATTSIMGQPIAMTRREVAGQLVRKTNLMITTARSKSTNPGEKIKHFCRNQRIIRRDVLSKKDSIGFSHGLTLMIRYPQSSMRCRLHIRCSWYTPLVNLQPWQLWKPSSLNGSKTQEWWRRMGWLEAWLSRERNGDGFDDAEWASVFPAELPGYDSFVTLSLTL